MQTQLRSALLAFAAVGIFSGTLPAQERFTLSGREVTIHNLAGSLRVEQGSGSVTEIEVRRLGRDGQRLQLVPGGDGATFRVIYPGDDIAYPGMRGNSQTSLTVADDGTFGRGTGEGRRVRVYSPNRAPAGAVEAGADIVVRVPTGVRLRTHVAVGDTEARGVSGAGLDLHTSSGSLEVERVRGDVTLSSASGSVNARDVEGQVSLRTASGSAELENVRGSAISVNVASGGIRADQLRAPNIELKTASGRIRASEVSADKLTLNSASGSVNARDVTAGEASIRTASGSIDLDLSAPIRSVELRAVSGSVHLRIPGNMGATLELETTSGGINVSGPMTVTTQRRGYTAGTIGDGRARVTAKTTSGSVTVSRR